MRQRDRDAASAQQVRGISSGLEAQVPAVETSLDAAAFTFIAPVSLVLLADCCVTVQTGGGLSTRQIREFAMEHAEGPEIALSVGTLSDYNVRIRFDGLIGSGVTCVAPASASRRAAGISPARRLSAQPTLPEQPSCDAEPGFGDSDLGRRGDRSAPSELVGGRGGSGLGGVGVVWSLHRAADSREEPVFADLLDQPCVCELVEYGLSCAREAELGVRGADVLDESP